MNRDEQRWPEDDLRMTQDDQNEFSLEFYNFYETLELFFNFPSFFTPFEGLTLSNSSLGFLLKSETPACSNFKYNSLFIVGFTLTFLKLPIYPSLT